MEEVWKDIKGYEELYKVSNLGRVMSLHKKTKISKGTEKAFLKLTPNDCGYMVVTLYKDNSRCKVLIHRLVAEAFIPNPHGLDMINHKDENKCNNAVDNLEWCDVNYNNKYGTARMRSRITKGRPVEQLSLDDIVIAKYITASLAAEIHGLTHSQLILDACNGKIKTAYGYKWRYAKEF